jgi:hypothetical protein
MRSIEPWNKSHAATIGVVLGAAILTGCHSRVPIAVPGSMPPPARSAVATELKAGDRVRITMRNGNREAFVIVEAQVEALVAEDGRRFPYADIALLEKTRISKTKTIALIAAMPFIMLVLVGLTYHGP